MRKLWVVTMLVWALGSGVASARVGETFAQCLKRYGTPTLIATPYEFAPEAKGLGYYTFQKNGINVQIGFIDGVACDMTYSHVAGNFTQVEIDTLLEANGAGMKWTTVNDGKLTFFPDDPTQAPRYGNYQQREDGVIATVDGIYLHIFTPQWMTYIAKKMKEHRERTVEDQKKNLEGF
jgi:hypothetical protein